MKSELTDDWKYISELVVYGFGKVAHDNIDFFKSSFNIAYIVDSDKEKCNCEFKGISVKHVEQKCCFSWGRP